MPRGFRLLIVAIGLGLACPSHTYAEAGEQKDQSQQSIASSLQDIATTGRQQAERAERADKDESPCGQGQYGSNSDLCAQWKAADAAADSAWWAWVAGISTIISTAAVLFAIGLTNQANSIARDTAKRQLRAHVLLEETRILIDGNGWGRVVLTFRNSGQTPAIDLVIYCWMKVDLVASHTDIGHIERDPKASRFSIGASSQRDKVVGPVEPDVINALQSGESVMTVWGVAEYRDIFGRAHWSEFKLFGGDSHGFAHEHPLIVAADGNREDGES